MKLQFLLFALMMVTCHGLPVDEGNNEIEELKQNLSLVWTEINRLKTDFQHHIQESDTPAFDLHNDEFQHGYDHHHNDSHHQEGDHQHEGDQHHGGDHQHGADHPHEGDHQHGADHHHEGDQHTDVGSGDGHDNTHANPDQHQGEHDHGYDHHGASDPYHSAEHDSYHHRYPHHDYHGDHNRNTDTRKQYSHSSKSDNDDDDDKKNDSGEDDDKDSSDEDKTPDKPQQDSKKTHHRGSDYRQPHNHHSYGHHQHHHHKKEDVIVAHCHLQPNVEYPGSEVNGHITIKQKSTGAGPLYFKINMKGFKIQEDGSGFIHGFHVHENGIQDQKCSTAGAHFNPSGVTHGAPYSIVRHVGDLGNIKVDKRGNLLDYLISDDTTKFFGPKSIVGRSIVVHALPDDLGLGGDEGSLSTGNAGARLACCTIEGKNIPPFMPTSPAIRFNG